MFFIYTTFGDEDDIDLIFPAPKFEGSSIESELTYLDQIDGCTFREDRNKSVVCMGLTCTQYPSSVHLQTAALKIRTTKISTIRKADFKNLENIKTLLIEFNFDLIRLEPGCFETLNQLTNLSISFNQNLKSLEIDVFQGLKNLKELYMNKNAFTEVRDITRALSPQYVPSLEHLYMTENVFRNVLKDDFLTMAGSLLEELQMVLCQIEYIHPASLNSLKNLRFLRLGQNQFNVSVIENLINECIQNRIPLRTLDLYDAGFRRKPPMKLLTLIAETNITHLSLGRNTFDNLNEYSFPKMPKIVVLDLSNCLLLDISVGTFDTMPNLKTLLLAGNRLPSIEQGIALSRLKKLDVSGNSGNPISRSYFRVDDNIFVGMDSLYALQLSNNLISQITIFMFAGLENLRYLSLKNATVFGIDPGSLIYFKHLEYLNLENNQFSTEITADVFQGMDELKILLLGGCSLESLPAIPSPFTYLPNLTYLGLERNSFYSISSNLFLPLVNMKNLDLSFNKLTEWNRRILNNISVEALDVSQNKFKRLTQPMMEDFQNLSMLNLEGNPFTCDCNMYPSSKWYGEHNFTLKAMRNEVFVAKCVNSDEWKQMSIFKYMEYLQINPKACDISAAFNKTALIATLSVISIIIVIVLISGYVYRLHVRHWCLLGRMAVRRYLRLRKNKFSSETNCAFKYDAFVSYSNEDQEFVINLVGMLENNEPYLKLCVYERDFQIGSVISESVLQSVASSRKTLLIVSDSFAKSQWCRWEAKLAEHHHLFFHDGDIKGPQGTLLIILLDNICEGNMTPTLKYLLKTRIYLEWCTDPEKQLQFWDKLRKKLASPNNGIYETCMSISET
ncbi:tollo [Carabus blaptoides fortunei]